MRREPAAAAGEFVAVDEFALQRDEQRASRQRA